VRNGCRSKTVIYGASVSKETISRITDKVVAERCCGELHHGFVGEVVSDFRPGTGCDMVLAGPREPGTLDDGTLRMDASATPSSATARVCVHGAHRIVSLMATKTHHHPGRGRLDLRPPLLAPIRSGHRHRHRHGRRPVRRALIADYEAICLMEKSS